MKTSQKKKTNQMKTIQTNKTWSIGGTAQPFECFLYGIKILIGGNISHAKSDKPTISL